MNMTKGRITPIFIRFSLPLLFGNLFQLFYSLTDSFIVGNYCGRLSLAAIGASGNIIFTVTGFASGLASGAGVVIAHAFGSNDKIRVLKSVCTALISAAILGVLLTAFGIAISPPMLKMISVPGTVFTEAVLYLRIYFSGVIFILFYNLCSALLRSIGDSKKTFYILVASVILNIILDLAFVLVYRRGLQGVAVATVISEVFSAVLAFAVLVRQLKKNGIIEKLTVKNQFSTTALSSILRIGLPGAISSVLLSFSNTFMQHYVNKFGVECMAGWAIYERFDELAILPMVSICMTATTFTGQNYGAKKLGRVYRGILVSTTLGIATMTVISVILIAFAPHIISVFNSEPRVIHYGAQFMRASACFYLFCFGSMVFNNISQGLGYSAVPTLIIFSGFVILRQSYLFVITRLTASSLAVALAYPIVWPSTMLFEIIYLRHILKQRILAQ